MILALVGGSGTGKTTLASTVANELGSPVRHCGDALRAAAAARGVGVADAPQEAHREVDRATTEWCDALTGALGVVEGRFLDVVLGPRADLLLVGLRAAESVRAERLTHRSGRLVDPTAVSALDQADDKFREAMYTFRPVTPLGVVIDTDGESAKECAAKILTFLCAWAARPPG